MDHLELSPVGGCLPSVERSHPATFSDAIDAIGMGPFQTRLILVCGMGWMIDAIEVLVVAFVLDDVADTFDLGSFDKGLVGSASFFGMLFGAIFWSVYADKYGRRSAFVLTMGCIFLAGLASAFAPSFRLLLVTRVIVGFGVGGNLPVASALITEFLPTSRRAAVLCHISGVFWGAGLTCASLVGLVLSNVLGSGREEPMWRWFLGLSAVPAVAVVLAYRLLPESARYLSVIGRHDEAREVLVEAARVNGKLDILGLHPLEHTGKAEQVRLQAGPATDDPAGNSESTFADADQQSGGFEKDSVDGGGQHNEAVDFSSGALYGDGDDAEHARAGDVRELFHTPILRRVTLCVWMVWLFVNLSYYGLTFLLPKYYKDITDGEDFVYILTAVVGMSFAPASVVALWLCSEDRLGRVGTITWSSLATSVLILLMGVFHSIPALFIPLSTLTLLAIAVPSITKYVITPELYATKYRAVGLGSASVWTRIGGILAPIVAEVLYEKGPVWPLVVFCPAMILTAIFSSMIPVETAGLKLDDDSWDRLATDKRGGGDREDETGSHLFEGSQGTML